MQKLTTGRVVIGLMLCGAIVASAQQANPTRGAAQSSKRLNTKSTRQLIEHFVEIYNMEGSVVYPLYANTLQWIEMPSGRRGGHDELFAALQGARTSMQNLHLDVLSITADENSGVLESELHAVRTSNKMPVLTRVLWFFTFENDKIVKEHDYSIAPATPTRP